MTIFNKYYMIVIDQERRMVMWKPFDFGET